MRSLAEAPDWEFAVELGLAVRAAPEQNPILAQVHNPYLAIEIADVPLTLPRIPYRTRSDREEIINMVVRDLRDSAGELGDAPRIILPS
jgi:hypothetical protein